MFGRLQSVEDRFEEISSRLQDSEISNDPQQYRSLMKEYSSLQEIVTAFREYKNVCKQRAGAKELLETEKDSDLRAMAKSEMAELEPRISDLEALLKILLLPKDPNDDKNILLEIRAGAGGDEASLFAEELFRAYSHFADTNGWKVEILSLSPGNVGGFKEVVALITGDKVFSKLKFESGVHRVQRVPKTEAQGRIHTSTITVAVLPEAEEVEIDINQNDLKIDVMRSGGAGGQSVNTTDSAVRLTHLPSGIVIVCQDERSQLKNKNKAMKILRARLLAVQKEVSEKEASNARLSQIGTGDRSERIRTYNFPQARVTDHRIGLTTHQLSDIMEGRVDIIIEPLITHFQAEALKQASIQ
ncbi:MAG: peptide chain release factor 1 [Bdellovibrionales bacterium CG10_big_fil_rev_8_21_14_0_10_45_34]|nr:MAG: peptide chain release factor 1 [Bdellovibrionales bacterium CG10_big_fil_rev_8_21_14_0_10_45_34]